jgi:hypothetical protein
MQHAARTRAGAIAAASLALILAACSFPASLSPEEPTPLPVAVESAAQGEATPPLIDEGLTPTPLIRTATPEPTAEAAPAGGEEPSQGRLGNGENLTIPFCAEPIVVDTDNDDWQMQAEPLRFAINTTVYGPADWDGLDDLSGQGRLCWTDEALYLFAEVVDDRHVQIMTGRDVWLGDEVELLFDADLEGDFDSRAWSGDDTQILLSPGDFERLRPEAVRFYPDTSAPAMEVDARPTEDGYWLEASLPWAVFRAEPEAGGRYGLCLSLSDDDRSRYAQQDSMVSTCIRLSVHDPTTWVTVELGE